MRIYGLTGGVACGKSTVAERFKSKGIPVIDTDEIAHELLAHDAQVRADVARHLGTVDRPALRKLIFDDPDKRKALEAILHPRISTRVFQEIDALKKKKTPPNAVIVVVPLLFEAGWDKKMDEVIAVVSSEKNQISRLMKRDKISEKLARSMVSAQLSNKDKAKRSNHVIQNDGSIHELNLLIDRLAEKF